MTTYQTNNPIGSTAVKDLYDNTENLDQAVNDRSTDKWTDRLGNERITWEGMTRLSNLGASVEAAERAESARDDAQDAAATALAANRTIFRATKSELLAAMQGPPLQEDETPGTVTNDPSHTDENPVNGNYVWRGGELVRSDVQSATSQQVEEAIAATEQAAGAVSVGFYNPGIYRAPLDFFGARSRVDVVNPVGNLVGGPIVTESLILASVVRAPLGVFGETPSYQVVDLNGQIVVGQSGDSVKSGNPLDVSACSAGGHLVHISAQLADGRYPLMSAPIAGGEYIQLAPDARGLSADGDAVLFTTGDGRPGGYRVPAAGGPVLPALPDSRVIVCWGDSMSNNTYEPALASLFPDRTVLARGISSQVSREIVARQGGKPATVTLPDAQIPASGSVVLSSISTPFLTSLASPTATRSMDGTLAGIHGTMTKSGTDTYTFTRTTNGFTVPCPSGTPFIPDDSVARRGDLMIWWAGTNDILYDGTTQGLLGNTIAAWDYIAPYGRGGIVCGPHNQATYPVGTSRYELTIEMATALSDEAASRGWVFADTRRYLIDHGLTDAGITPTADDTTAISNDCVPPSLRIDSLHLNSVANQLVAGFLHQVINTNGL